MRVRIKSEVVTLQLRLTCVAAGGGIGATAKGAAAKGAAAKGAAAEGAAAEGAAGEGAAAEGAAGETIIAPGKALATAPTEFSAFEDDEEAVEEDAEGTQFTRSCANK